MVSGPGLFGVHSYIPPRVFGGEMKQNNSFCPLCAKIATMIPVETGKVIKF